MRELNVPQGVRQAQGNQVAKEITGGEVKYEVGRPDEKSQAAVAAQQKEVRREAVKSAEAERQRQKAALLATSWMRSPYEIIERRRAATRWRRSTASTMRRIKTKLGYDGRLGDWVTNEFEREPEALSTLSVQQVGQQFQAGSCLGGDV